MFWYGTGRAMVEGLRTDSLYIPGTNIRTSQLVAACSAVIALIILLVNIKRPHKPTFASVQAAEAAAAEAAADSAPDNAEAESTEATGAEAAAAEASEEAGAGSTASESAPGGDSNE